MKKTTRTREKSTIGEARFIKAYRKNFKFPRPSVTVDILIFTVLNECLQVLLIRRGQHPYQGSLAIPGGFVDVGDGFQHRGESLLDAARREIEEETGIPGRACYLEQLYTFGDPDRDQRMRVISVAYYALVRPHLAPWVRRGSDAAEAKWVPVDDALKSDLAFDHKMILETAVQRIRGKVDYSDIAFELVPNEFTTGDLRRVFETVKGEPYDPGNFTRRFRRLLEDKIVQEVKVAEGRRTGGRRARVYQFTGRPAVPLHHLPGHNLVALPAASHRRLGK